MRVSFWNERADRAHCLPMPRERGSANCVLLWASEVNGFGPDRSTAATRRGSNCLGRRCARNWCATTTADKCLNAEVESEERRTQRKTWGACRRRVERGWMRSAVVDARGPGPSVGSRPPFVDRCLEEREEREPEASSGFSSTRPASARLSPTTRETPDSREDQGLLCVLRSSLSTSALKHLSAVVAVASAEVPTSKPAERSRETSSAAGAPRDAAAPVSQRPELAHESPGVNGGRSRVVITPADGHRGALRPARFRARERRW